MSNILEYRFNLFIFKKMGPFFYFCLIIIIIILNRSRSRMLPVDRWRRPRFHRTPCLDAVCQLVSLPPPAWSAVAARPLESLASAAVAFTGAARSSRESRPQLLVFVPVTLPPLDLAVRPSVRPHRPTLMLEPKNLDPPSPFPQGLYCLVLVPLLFLWAAAPLFFPDICGAATLFDKLKTVGFSPLCKCEECKFSILAATGNSSLYHCCNSVLRWFTSCTVLRWLSIYCSGRKHLLLTAEVHF